MDNVKKFRIIKFKSKPILAAKSISKSFDKRIILRKIDIHLNQGEMLGLLGSNGAGKSTFMNIVLGLIKCDFGDIFLGNKKLTNLAIHDRSKLGISYLPQNSAIFRGLTVYENLLGVAQIIKKRKDEQRDIVEKLMVEFSITHLRDVRATALSGGERRRLAIAMSLVGNPKIILMDEPLSHLDPITIDMLKRIILNLQRKNISVIISDHNFSALLSISDRCIVISDGEVIISGNPRDIIHDKKAKEFYFGEGTV